MKKIREMLPIDERMKLILSASAVGLVLIAAMLIPLAFRTSGTSADRDTARLTEQKAALFAEYWDGMTDTENVRAIKQEEIPLRQKEQCSKTAAALLSKCIRDLTLEEPPEPTGVEYTDLIGTDGTEVKLCRVWLEARGDWQNWLDACFDRETGELYYLYLSRECVSNPQAYETELAQAMTANTVAEALCDAYGWTLRFLSAEEGDSGTAVFCTESGLLCCQISCRTYDMLIDVKFCCI